MSEDDSRAVPDDSSAAAPDDPVGSANPTQRGGGDGDAEPAGPDPAAGGSPADGEAAAVGDAASSAGPPSLERESEVAADYLEELLDIADLDGDIDMDVEGDRAAVSVVGGDLKHLVGPGGVVLDALQELTRLAVQTQTGVRSRLMLDIAGYRAGRRAELSELGRRSAQQARESAAPVRLDPMTPFERKVVHDAVAAAGLRSESEGEEPQRRVVVLPK